MTTMTYAEHGYAPEYLDRDEELLFRSWHGLPNPSLGYFLRNGISTDDLLANPSIDCAVTALLKRLANEGRVDNQLLVNTLACALHSDDPAYTAYNAFVLLDYFTKTRFQHGLSESNFASAVAGLSAHNGAAGHVGMHRLSEPEEIAGAAAVVMFIGTMNRNRLVKPTTLEHAGKNLRKELATTNRYLDRLLRLNPEHLDSVRDYLLDHWDKKITIRRNFIQPIIDHIEAEGMTVRLDSLLAT